MYYSFYIAVILFSWCRVLPFFGEETYHTVQYSIGKESQLTIQGYTNVNSFRCLAEQGHQKSELRFTRGAESGKWFFQNTSLGIGVDCIDCGSKMINGDLREMLKAEKYPEFFIDLQSVRGPFEANRAGLCQHYSADIEVRLVGETRTYCLPVSVDAIGEKEYRLQGDMTLLLSDYDIEAPKPVFGLIKVQDKLEIHFNLIVTLFS